MLCIRGTSHGPVSVRLSVRSFVTSRCSTKTTKRRITKIKHHTIAQGLTFSDAKDLREIRPGSHLRGRQMQVGWVIIGDFRQITGYISKRYKIDAWFLLKSNRKSYALHPMVILSMTSSTPPNCPKPPHFLHFAPPFIASQRVKLETSNLVH